MVQGDDTTVRLRQRGVRGDESEKENFPVNELLPLTGKTAAIFHQFLVVQNVESASLIIRKVMKR